MALRNKEPVRYTCPDIDKMIGTITSIVKQMANCDTEDEKETLLEQIADWKSDLENIGIGKLCDLESLRSSNAALREWGKEMYDAANTLENERDSFEYKCEALKDEISDLTKEISQLVQEIEELQDAQ